MSSGFPQLDIEWYAMRQGRNMEPLATALRKLLDARNMTDTELMALAGVSPATVTRYLKGSRGRRMDKTSIPTVEKLARALEVPPDHFLEFRMWRIQEIMKRHPELVDEIYDLLVAEAEAEESNLRNKRRSKGP